MAYKINPGVATVSINLMNPGKWSNKEIIGYLEEDILSNIDSDRSQKILENINTAKNALGELTDAVQGEANLIYTATVYQE